MTLLLAQARSSLCCYYPIIDKQTFFLYLFMIISFVNNKLIVYYNKSKMAEIFLDRLKYVSYVLFFIGCRIFSF